MKTITILTISVLVFFSIAATPAPEKETPAKNVKAFDGFSSLRSHRQGKGAVITWSFTSASGVSGFVVQRTNEDPTDPYSVWVTVGSQGCDGSRSYKCCDETPTPGYINYRVTAVLNNGTTIESAVSVVHIAAH